jgi:pimeloyl-ACP methyl ester carboxylesterase/RimJ/RimL family protein N-acetyltransferase
MASPPGPVKSRRLTLVPCAPEVAEAVIVDRAKAEWLLGARLHPEWPGSDTRGFLSYYARMLRQDPRLLGWGVWLMIREEMGKPQELQADSGGSGREPARVVIGDLGFKGRPGGGVVDIGYAVVPAERRNGYASEAARALVNWAFRRRGAKVEAVIAACEEDNPSSVKVLQSIGMRRNGRDRTLLKWKMTRRDWERTLPGSSDAKAAGSRKGLHYVERGSGFPVLLVHGFGSSSTIWMYTLPALAEAGYRAIALDLPGFGHSYLPEVPITTSSYAKDVVRVMDDLGIEEAALVGNSMGGFVAWSVAVRAPERVRALVLVDSAGAPPGARDGDKSHPLGPGRRHMLYGNTGHQDDTGHAGPDTAGGRLSRGHLTNVLFRHLVGLRIMDPLTRLLATPLIDLVYGDPSRMTREVFDALHGAAKQARIIYAGRLTWQPQEDAATFLSQVRCPTLVAWGDKDRIIPLEAMGFFMANIPNAVPVVFEGAGHAPMLEVPQDFNRAVVKFLDSMIGSSG